MNKITLLILAAIFAATNIYADYPLDTYTELEDTKEVDYTKWAELTDDTYFTWGSRDVHYSYKNVPDVEFKTDTSITAWKGERVSALALIYSKVAVPNLSLSLTSSNRTLKNASSANFVNYVMTDEASGVGEGSCGYREDHSLYDSSMVADVIDNQTIKSLDEMRVRPVWCSFEIPSTLSAGEYTVVLYLLDSDNAVLKELNLTINVLEYELPDPSDYVFTLDIWQQPYAVSRYYGVENWSEEHFEAMRPMMEHLARAGQRTISTEIIYEPWGDQSHDKFIEMISTTKKTDGSWEYDYTVFDNWVEFMMSCGIDKEIKCFSMVPWDMSFKYYDEASGEDVTMYAETTSTDYSDFWTPFISQFADHLREKGWFDITMICMDERGIDAMLNAYNLLKSVEPDMKMALAGSYHSELIELLDDYSFEYTETVSTDQKNTRAELGLNTTMYISCSAYSPNSNTFSSPAEAACMTISGYARGYNGFLRWAYNNWGEDPLRDSRYRLFGAGDTYMIYPGFRSSVRFERFIEGMQNVEKCIILQNEYEESGDEDSQFMLVTLLNTFGQDMVTPENAGELVNSLELFLNGEAGELEPATEYCEVGLSTTGIDAALAYRWLTSATTTGALVNLNYSSSTQSSDGWVTSEQMTAMRGTSFSLNLVATSNSDDIRYTRAGIFADWNGDMLFNTINNEYVAMFGTFETGDEAMLDITTEISIPDDSTIGETLIRVRYNDAWADDPLPCGDNVKGFTFDIPLLITEPTAIAQVNTDNNLYKVSGKVITLTKPLDVTIYSADGIVVIDKKSTEVVNLSSLPSGVYIAQLRASDEVVTFKISL